MVSVELSKEEIIKLELLGFETSDVDKDTMSQVLDDLIELKQLRNSLLQEIQRELNEVKDEAEKWGIESDELRFNL